MNDSEIINVILVVVGVVVVVVVVIGDVGVCGDAVAVFRSLCF